MRFDNVIRYLLLPLGAATALLAAAPVQGQIRVIPRERLDSLANPSRANGSEAMQFEQLVISTGNIGEDDGAKSVTYRWKNVGKTPLVITRVNTTCGCTVPSYDRQPVMPGQTSEMTVTYHPKGHPGRIQRKIFIFTQLSASLPSAILQLTGQVVPSTRPTYAYPYAKGKLLLKRQELRFDPSTLSTESIECLNAGDDTLRVAVDTRMLPPCIKAVFSPEKLAPGGLGELIVRFDPAAGKPAQRIPLFLKGLGVSPGESSITIRIAPESDETKQRE